jgi:hypothetical protein
MISAASRSKVLRPPVRVRIGVKVLLELIARRGLILNSWLDLLKQTRLPAMHRIGARVRGSQGMGLPTQ